MADETQQVENGFDALLGKIPTSLGGNFTPPTSPDTSKGSILNTPKNGEIPLPKDDAPGTSTNTSKENSTNSPSDEEIQNRLTELEGKDQESLTDEEKEFIQKYTETDTDNSAIGVTQNYFKEKYGYTPEEGKKYEDSPEGLSLYVDDVVPSLAQSMIENYFREVPLMGEFYNHVVVEGKSINTFLTKNKDPEYKSIELKETSSDFDDAINKKIVDNQKALIRMNYSAKGIDGEMIDKIIELSELNGTLFTDASKSRDGLKASHAKLVQDQMAAEEKAKEAEEQQRISVLNQAKNIIKTNDFGGLSINPAHLKNFEKALLEQDSQGKSLLDYKREKLTLAQRLYIDYLVLTDFKATPYKKSPTQSKSFNFKAKAEQNDSRNGGRIRGGSTQGNDSNSGINNLKDFLSSNIKQS